MLTVQEATRLISDKPDFYNALKANLYWLPLFDSAIVTKDFLLNVRDRITYCPKYTDLVLRPCIFPPSTQVVHAELCNYIGQGRANMNAVDYAPFQSLLLALTGKPADKQWMLDCLSTLSLGNHEYFQKGFVPQRNLNQQAPILVNNADGFFTGLVPSKSKKKSGKQYVMNALQVEQLKLERQQQVQARHEAQIQRQQLRVNQLLNRQANQIEQVIPQQQLRQQPAQFPNQQPQLDFNLTVVNEEMPELEQTEERDTTNRTEEEFKENTMLVRARGRHERANVIRNRSGSMNSDF